MGILAIGLGQWRAQPLWAQPPTSTSDCEARVLKETRHDGWEASVRELLKRCAISGHATAITDSTRSEAVPTTTGVSNLADSPVSAPLAQADTDADQPPPVLAQAGPTNQRPPAVYAGRGNSVRTSTGAPITQVPAGASTVNVKDFGASGSDNSYKCSIAAGSTTLTCTTSTDFQAGQYVAVPTAGIPSPLTPAGTPTVTNLGSLGSTTDCYEIVAGDPAEGLTAPSAPGCITTGPAAPFTTASGLAVSFTGNGNPNSAYGVYRSINGGPYFLVNVVTGYSYNDYGGDLPTSYDWPAVAPGARNQTLYAAISGGSGDSWALDTSAVSQATGVKVCHDDTPAVQAAYDAASGKQVYFPAGTYHLNMILLLLGSTPAGYRFTPATLRYHAAGSILQTGSSILSTGNTTTNTIIQRDWAWRVSVGGVIWNVAPAPWAGYTGPQKSDGTPSLPSYALNNAAHGALSVTTHRTPDATNFHVGDFVYITGGQAVNGSYSASNITQVRTVDLATGTIGIADPLTVDIPWGTGYPAFIEDLTTNSVAQYNIGFQNMTIQTPSTPVSLNDTYGVTWQNISMPKMETHLAELFYNEWSARVSIYDNPLITLDSFEFPLSSYLTVGPNNNWYIGQRSKNAFVVNGASTPLAVSENAFVFPCGGGFALEGTIAEADIQHNHFATLCSDPGVQNDSSTVTFGVSIGNSLGYSWVFSNNDIYTNSSRAMAVNSHNAMPTSTVISHNLITWDRGPTQA
jgi:hypothetical protein